MYLALSSGKTIVKLLKPCLGPAGVYSLERVP